MDKSQTIELLLTPEEAAEILRVKLSCLYQHKRIGRPRAIVDVEAVSKLREGGRSLREIAVRLNIPVSRVRRALFRLQLKSV